MHCYTDSVQHAIGCIAQCRSAFQHYVAQDAFFLKAFAQAYALAMAQTADPEQLKTLQTLLAGVHQELEMHQGFAKVLNFAT